MSMPLARWCAVAATTLLVSGTAAVIGPVSAYAGNFVAENGSDFNCDGARDFVTAHEDTPVDGREHAGEVTIRYAGSDTVQTINQNTPGVPGSAENWDAFGRSYAVYDRNKDGCDDLVVGVPNESIGDVPYAGMIVFIPGSPSGLDTTKAIGYDRADAPFHGKIDSVDSFGQTLAAGATSGGVPFLLVGTPGAELSWDTGGAGVVYYVRPDRTVSISQNSPGVAGTAEQNDEFGTSLAVSDRFFVIGTPREAIGSRKDAGMVHVFSHTLTSGRPTPLAGISQNSSGVGGTAEAGDWFGEHLSVLAYRPSTSAPIAALVSVGTSREAVGSLKFAGMAHLLSVTADKRVTQQLAVTQNSAGVSDSAEEYDQFGHDVVLADVDPASTAPTPIDIAWAVVARGESTAGEYSAVHAFHPGWRSGDVLLVDGEHGIPEGSVTDMAVLRASESMLHVGEMSAVGHEPRVCIAVPWVNVFNGGTEPVAKRPDDCL